MIVIIMLFCILFVVRKVFFSLFLFLLYFIFIGIILVLLQAGKLYNIIFVFC